MMAGTMLKSLLLVCVLLLALEPVSVAGRPPRRTIGATTTTTTEKSPTTTSKRTKSSTTNDADRVNRQIGGLPTVVLPTVPVYATINTVPVALPTVTVIATVVVAATATVTIVNGSPDEIFPVTLLTVTTTVGTTGPSTNIFTPYTTATLMPSLLPQASIETAVIVAPTSSDTTVIIAPPSSDSATVMPLTSTDSATVILLTSSDSATVIPVTSSDGATVIPLTSTDSFIIITPTSTDILSSAPISTTASVVVPPVPTGPVAAVPAPLISTPTIVGNCLPNCTFSAENKCFNTLGEAINAVQSGATISLASGAVLSGETSTTKNIFLTGCEAGRSRVTVQMDSSHGGVIFATGKDQSIGFYKLSVLGAGMTNFSSMLRTPELGDEAHFTTVKTGPVSLFINDCDFSDFRTQARGGSVIFIGKPKDVSITNSEFRNNKCVTFQNKNRFDGGGAVWLLYLIGQGLVQNCQFTGNTHEFGHSVGAALMVLNMENGTRFDVLDSLFQDNIADSGGAIYFRDLKRGSVLNINSRFVHNTCNYTKTYGCRGGAAWIQNIAGQVFITGSFEYNEAIEDRGAVFANNRIHPSGRVVLSGTYTNNHCTKGAAVWDTLYGLEKKAELTVLLGSVFQGNLGENNRDMILRLLYEKPTQEEIKEGTDVVTPATNETIADGSMRTIVRTETHWVQSGKQWNFVGGTPNPTGELEF